jgi:DNA-binding CsgD family transcriptional regulator
VSSGTLSWHDLRDRVIRRDNNQCQQCGQYVERTTDEPPHVHHKIPDAEGGSDTLSNLITLCEACHTEYHAQDRREDLQTTPAIVLHIMRQNTSDSLEKSDRVEIEHRAEILAEKTLLSQEEAEVWAFAQAGCDAETIGLETGLSNESVHQLKRDIWHKVDDVRATYRKLELEEQDRRPFRDL